jgi:DnaJ-class molecular chaperone
MKTKSKCPFCGGTKVKPFMGNTSQDCQECDKDGMIKNSKLKKLHLDDMIEK